jgi:hypothetical protein
MRFDIEFNNEQDESTLSLIADGKHLFGTEQALYVELNSFYDLKSITERVSKLKGKKYNTLISFGTNIPMIYFQEI